MQIATHFQFCKTLCKHPERVIESGVMSEQLSQLLRRSILWMIKRGKLGHIISWKYIKYFELYDETTINDVISIASVEMVRLILYSFKCFASNNSVNRDCPLKKPMNYLSQVKIAFRVLE